MNWADFLVGLCWGGFLGVLLAALWAKLKIEIPMQRKIEHWKTVADYWQAEAKSKMQDELDTAFDLGGSDELR